MEQAGEESIYQPSAATDQQEVHQVLSWQQMAATFNPQVQLDDIVEANKDQKISDPSAQDHIGLNMGPLFLDSNAYYGSSVKGQGSLSVQFNVGFEARVSGSTIHPIYGVVNLAFGQNQSETIYRLRILALFNLVFHAIVGVPYLFGDFYSIRATYLVMLMMTIGAIVVALIRVRLDVLRIVKIARIALFRSIQTYSIAIRNSENSTVPLFLQKVGITIGALLNVQSLHRYSKCSPNNIFAILNSTTSMLFSHSSKITILK